MRIRYSTASDGRPVKKAFVYTREEHRIDLAHVDEDAVRIVERLKASGHETYIVGGAVRDLMVGKKPKDFDIVTDATPSRIKKVFRNSRIIGRRFRLVHVYFGPKIFEVSTFRSLKDGPTSNTYGTVEEDVLRRDFSMNALFYDPQEQVVVDYVGGVRDIKRKLVKAIIPLKVIFADDPVRMLRAAKYAASTGFRIPFLLSWKIKRQSSLLGPVSPSRLTEELFKIINSGFSKDIVGKALELGLFGYLQPQAVALMRASSSFKGFYLASLGDLDALVRECKDTASGKYLSFLLRDYVDTLMDWTAEPLELYRAALASCRTFVLPINPPRIELENAVRSIFREHGIAVKKARTFEKGRNKESVPEGAGDPRRQERETPTVEGDSEGAKKKRRRRRTRRKPPAPPAGGASPQGGESPQ